MSHRATALIGVVVGLLILLAGSAFALLRPATYQSTATLLLAPTPSSEDAVPSVLEAFVRSGTAGTYVELIGSRDTLRRAGSPPVEITARAVPDSRVITVTATGDRDVVQPAVSAVVGAASRAETRLRDVWTLEVIERSTPPTKSGPGTGLILLASVVLALMAAALVVVALRRFGSVARDQELAPKPDDALRTQPRGGRDVMARHQLRP